MGYIAGDFYMRNPDDIRQSLAATVLLVRGGRATSRRDLATGLGISPTTAGQYADDLIRRGCLRETGLEQGAAGRPKRRLETVADAGWFAGIEFNAERLRAVAVDFSGQRREGLKVSLPEDCGAEALLELTVDAIGTLGAGLSAPLLGIGFGSPGIVDPVEGRGVTYAFLSGWEDVPVAAWLGERLAVPVTLENNLRTIALAERWFGGAQEVSDYIVLGPRSGFGIAVVQGGRLVRGARHAAGEIGYWPWPPEAGEARLHDRLSSPAVWRRLAGKGPRAHLPADLHEALSVYTDDRGAAREAIIADWARVIAMLHWLLDPSVFFLHGPLTALGEAFCREINEAAARLAAAVAPISEAPRLCLSVLDDEAGALGAATLAMERWQPAQAP